MELIVSEVKSLFVVTQLKRGRHEPKFSHNEYSFHHTDAKPYDGELKGKLGIDSLRIIWSTVKIIDYKPR